MGVYQGDKPLSRYGKSAYQQAVEGGYTGTQEEFNALLASVGNKQDKITGTSGQVVGFDTDGNLVAQEAPSSVTDEEKAAWNAKADAPFKPAGKSYLTFSSPNSFTLAVNDITKHWDGILEYFDSNKTWDVWDGTTTLSSVNNDGEHVLYLRGTGNTKTTGDNSNYKWVLTGSDIACIGNIENLLDYATVESGAHPTMAEDCYSYMFAGCTGLTQAPELHATTLASSCYHYMFYGCTALTQAPALPATTLANYCYLSMFRKCTSLTQAPALPATTLADHCYQEMFYGCTNLTQAPTLPATTLTIYCYQQMFYGCTSLTQTPTLPAATLAINCYEYMFQGCTSLTQTPTLPAATLADYCYAGMFKGCTSLIKIPDLPATILAGYCYQEMFRGCTNLTQAPALPATTLADSCYQSMFHSCRSLTQAPALPATTLANYCYHFMFGSCSSLTQAPDLPATTLAEGCYSYMFYNCTSIKLSATQIDEYTQEYRIPSSGTGLTAADSLTDMFTSTGGTFTGTPVINTTYYLSSDNMVVRETDIATLNGYVGAMIDAVTPESIGAAPSSHTSDTTVHITAAERTAWNAKLDSFTETDPTVPAWAKASSKPTYTASEVSAVPISGTTMKGALVAQNNTNLTTKQVRNITISTTEPTSGDGAVGDIWIVYEA